LSRKASAIKREILPDQKFNSVLVSKFINCIMKRGKRSTAERILYGAMDAVIKKMPETNPVELFNQAIENIKPLVEVKSRRVGGANYQIPIEVLPGRRQALAFRWLLDASRARGEKTMSQRLSGELMDAYNKTGSAMRKREETHRMAEANKAFAHYRW
jgi:small subunit ribosomal protein S7